MIYTGHKLAQVEVWNIPNHIQAPKATTNQPPPTPIIHESPSNNLRLHQSSFINLQAALGILKYLKLRHKGFENWYLPNKFTFVHVD